MKRGTILSILLIMILFFSLASAIEIKDFKEEYLQGETMLIKVSGAFVEPLTREKIQFYKGFDGHEKVAFDYDLNQIEGEYYIYASLPTKQSNYTLAFEEIKYRKANDVVEETIKRNISIGENTADFTIKPGFVVVRGEKEFSVSVENIKGEKITLSVEGIDYDLFSGETKKLDFQTKSEGSSTLKELSFSSGDYTYNLPVYIISNNSETIKEDKLEISPLKINSTFVAEKNYSIPITLKNGGDTQIDSISLSFSGDLQTNTLLSTTEIVNLEVGEESKVYLNFSSEIEKSVQGSLVINTESSFYYVPIDVEFISATINDSGDAIVEETCFDLGGYICSENTYCDSPIIANGQECCLNPCQELKDEKPDDGENSTGKIIGWSIVIILSLIVAWFFFKKYRKTGNKSTSSLEKVTKKKSSLPPRPSENKNSRFKKK